MQLYFVRHGESEGNAAGLHQLATTPLSDVGLSQARLLAHRFKHIEIDGIVSSSYRRAQQTAQEIAQVTGKQVETLEELHEIRKPPEIQGRGTHDPEVLAIKQLLVDHLDEPDWHYSTEENYYDVMSRAQRFWLLMEQRPEKSLVAVTHGSILVCILGVFLLGSQASPKEMLEFRHKFEVDNTGITVMNYREGQWTLKTWNDSAHLG